MNKPMLLIVDDEKPTREGLRAALEDRFEVYLAEDARAAMDLLEREHFDVVLTDFRLPNEDGMKPPMITSPRADCRLTSWNCGLPGRSASRSWKRRT